MLQPSFQPRLEGLEERWVPSTLTVQNNHDSGKGSLRAAVAAAHNGDTIVFAPGLDGQTITLTSGELLLKHNITIAGPGAGQLTISGDNVSRVFELSSSSRPQVALSGLTIDNGSGVFATGSTHTKDGEGGAILNEGTLTISNCVLSGNSAAYDGGAIHNDGTLTVTNTTLSGNSALNGGTGGGIENFGTLTVTNTTLSGNSAGYGGGIDNGPTGTLVITAGSTLSSNSAADGGAIYNWGAVTVSGSTLSGNSARASGGGIFNGNKGTVTVSGSIFSGNTAGYEGGGIFNEGSTVMVTDSTFSGNTPDDIFGPYVDGGGNYLG